MLTLKNFDKVLVSYLYEPDKLIAEVVHTPAGPTAELRTIKGQRKGVIVALDAGVLGWSLCNTSEGWGRKGFHTGDKFDKAKGLDLALKRADIASTLSVLDRESFYKKVPQPLIELFEQMEVRAAKYFAEKDSEEISE